MLYNSSKFDSWGLNLEPWRARKAVGPAPDLTVVVKDNLPIGF